MSSTPPPLFKNGILHNTILEDMLNCMHVPHNRTLESINNALQGIHTHYRGWLRTSERWQAQSDRYEELRQQLMPYLKDLGYVEEIRPTKHIYDYCLLLGSDVHDTRLRLRFLTDRWHNGIRYNTIMALGSARPLDPAIENLAYLLDGDNGIMPIRQGWHFDGTAPTTEAQMMRLIIDQAAMPEELRPRFEFIEVPLKVTAEGKSQRPTTGDTVDAWLATQPAPGLILAISNQPFIRYQHSVLKTLLPSTFTIETVGDKAEDTEKIAIYLDTLAREIYQNFQGYQHYQHAA